MRDGTLGESLVGFPRILLYFCRRVAVVYLYATGGGTMVCEAYTRIEPELRN
jgi:hypothetical protein